MSLGATAQGKQLLLLRQDGRTATQTLVGESQTMVAGNLVSIDSGPTLSAPLGLTRKLVDVCLHATVNNLNATAGNWIQVGPLVALFSTFNIYLNNHLTFSLPSASGDDCCWHVLKHGYTDVCGKSELADAYAEDDIGIVPEPPDAAQTLASLTYPMSVGPTIPGVGSKSVSQSLSRFLLPDLLSHLPIGCGGVSSIRFELGFPNSFNELGKHRLPSKNVATIDADLQVTGLQIQLHFIDTAIAASPKLSPSLKLSWPRWETKRYSLPFTPGVTATQTKYTVNISNEFSHTAAIDRVLFWFAPNTAAGNSLHGYPLQQYGDQAEECSGLTVRENGQTVHDWSRVQLLRHMNRSHQFKTGHHLYPGPSSTAVATQSGFWFSMSNLSRPVLAKGGAVSTKLLGGKNNKASTIEMDVKVTPLSDNTWTTVDMCVCLVRDTVAELNCGTGDIFVQDAS